MFISTIYTISGGTVTITTSQETGISSTQISFTGDSTEPITLSIINSNLSPADRIVLISSASNSNSEAYSAISSKIFAASGVDISDALASTGASQETIDIIKSTIGLGKVTITLSQAATELLLDNIKVVLESNPDAFEFDQNIISKVASDAIVTFKAVIELTPELGTTLVPTAVNDVSAAISAELPNLDVNQLQTIQPTVSAITEIKASFSSFEVPEPTITPNFQF